MQVEFLASFNKDLNKLTVPFVRQALRKLILRIEGASSLSEIPNVKKLVGHSTAYRVRLGDFRVGFFFDNHIVQFARILHRKDIYKLFP